MRSLWRGRRKERPCPWCATPVQVGAERCDGCRRRLRPMANVLTLPRATDITVSDEATQGLARRD